MDIKMDRLRELAKKLAEMPDQILPHEVLELTRILHERFDGAMRDSTIKHWQRELLW